VTASRADELLDVLEAFVGHLHCGAQAGGIDTMRTADLTFSQIRTMLTLAQNPEPVPINEIATSLELSVATAGRNVDQLVRAGLVERHEDDQDRRIKRISISPAGRELIRAFKHGQRRSALAILTQVDEPDARRLIEALRPIVAKLGCTPRGQSEMSPLHQNPAYELRQEIPA
jgi:DNA-binding MarR family transcriptional regulator